MKEGEFIVCYRSGVGIDRLARVITIADKMENTIPWEDDEKRRAYVAKVRYESIKKPITKEEFWDDLKDIAKGNEEPIDLIRGQIRYAYAMKLPKNAFDKIIDLAECGNPGIVKKWLDVDFNRLEEFAAYDCRFAPNKDDRPDKARNSIR